MFLSFVNSISFFAAVEQMRTPGLRGRPVGVAVPSSRRSPVLSASVEAEKEGIIRGMPVGEALTVCPGLKIVPPDFSLYRKVSEEMLKIAFRFSPSVETSGPGHSFVNLRGTTRLWGTPENGVRKIQKEVKERLNISTSAGLSRYRFVSQVASHLSPEGDVLKIEDGREFDFLKHTPVNFLPGIEYHEFKLISSLNISKAGELLALEKEHLTGLLGKKGERLYRSLHLLLNPPVGSSLRKNDRVSSSAYLFPETNSTSMLKNWLLKISADIALKLERRKRYAGLLLLSIFYTDGIEEKRSIRLFPHSKNEMLIYASLRSAISRRKRRKKVRKIEVVAEKLTPFSQMPLFPPGESEKLEKIDAVIKSLREKYSSGVIQYGSALSHP